MEHRSSGGGSGTVSRGSSSNIGSIPQDCTSEKLFQDAVQMQELRRTLDHLENEFEGHFLRYYAECPAGYSDKAREMWALQEIRTKHSDFWNKIEGVKTQRNSIIDKVLVVNAATRVLAVESGLESQFSS